MMESAWVEKKVALKVNWRAAWRALPLGVLSEYPLAGMMVSLKVDDLVACWAALLVVQRAEPTVVHWAV